MKDKIGKKMFRIKKVQATDDLVIVIDEVSVLAANVVYTSVESNGDVYYTVEDKDGKEFNVSEADLAKDATELEWLVKDIINGRFGHESN